MELRRVRKLELLNDFLDLLRFDDENDDILTTSLMPMVAST